VSVSLLRWVLLTLLAAAWLPSAQAQGRIPTVHAPAFNGAIVDLPGALKGKVGVLVIGFSQSSRDQIADWSKRLAADYRSSAAVTYYEMPVLEDVPRPLRSFVVGRVKESVPEVARSRCIPILEHEADWKALSGYSAPDQAYLLLVDENGMVRARMQGPVNDKSYAQLRSQIESLRPAS
jgi:hypothetical protein